MCQEFLLASFLRLWAQQSTSLHLPGGRFHLPAPPGATSWGGPALVVVCLWRLLCGLSPPACNLGFKEDSDPFLLPPTMTNPFARAPIQEKAN